MSNADSNLIESSKPAILVPSHDSLDAAKRPSRLKIAVAFGVAAISDICSMLTEFAPPLQWAIDGTTAILLFLILGRRWALLPGLVTEAIPGMGVFPVWVLVVLSIAIYDGIKKPAKT